METLPNLDPRDLVIFYFVATEKSLTSAAEKLHFTQPAITYHVKSLEESVRIKLLEFKNHQVLLTPHGEGVFKYAEVIYQQLVSADQFIKSIKESNLRVGIANIYNPIVGPVLESVFNQEYPEIKLIVKSGDAFEMVQCVMDSRLDCAIVPRFNYKNGKLNHVTVSAPEKLVCFASYDHPIEGEPLGWEDLCNYPLIVGTEASVVRRTIFKKLTSEGLEIKQLAAEVDNIEWLVTMVENGKGLSFILAKDIENQLKDKRLKIIELKENIYITAEAITRSETFTNSIVNKFVSMVKKAFKFTDSPTHNNRIFFNCPG